MRKTHDLVATVGEWKDTTGAVHKRRLTVGCIFESSKGALSIKIETLPVSPAWSGYLAAVRCLPPGRKAPPGWPQDPTPDPDAR